MNRPVNFSAGPSIIPVDVLQSLAAEMPDYRGSGLSLIEVSHRGPAYSEVHHQTLALIRELMGVPDDYSVLLIGGGATLQFSMLPMNFLPPEAHADYVNSGAWAKKAVDEARKVGRVNMLWDGTEGDFTSLPNPDELQSSPGAAYFHITSNETIGGVQWKSFPDTGSVPLTADMSSDILSRPVDVSRFGLIYAGAQKNLGPSGVTIIVVRNSLLERCPESLGSYLSYAVHAKSDSLYNTPPVFSIWAMKLVLEGLKKRGGVEAAARENAAQAAALYRAVDDSQGFYTCPVDKSVRSNMNVVWRLGDREREGDFLERAASEGLLGLKGHRSVGGCRASLYNAMEMNGVTRLIDFMERFANQ